MTYIKNIVISEDFRKKVSLGSLNSSELEEIFLRTTELLTEEELKAGYLIYPTKPRECEARQIMSGVLSERKIAHMIERPFDNLAKDFTKGRPLFVDLSIYTQKGIIDIEFKESLSDIRRDFPKLIAGPNIGCALFYIFHHKKIDRVLEGEILSKYQNVYEKILDELDRKKLVRDKWFRFFLLSFREKRVFSMHYDSMKNINFYKVSENEKYLHN